MRHTKLELGTHFSRIKILLNILTDSLQIRLNEALAKTIFF